MYLEEKDFSYLLKLQDGCSLGNNWLLDMQNDVGAYANALESIKKISKGVDWEGTTPVKISGSIADAAMLAIQDINKVRNDAKAIRSLLAGYCGSNSLPVRLNVIRTEIGEYFDCAGRLNATISKWLHDESQYRLGLFAFITKFNEPKFRVLERDDIHKIDAFRFAMKMLQRSSFSKQTEMCEIGIHRIFQRYRYCFSTPDVRWKLWRTQHKTFNQRLRVRIGFETVPLNLLDNAVKYLPKNKIHRSVVVSFYESEEVLYVTVRSYGPPRSEEELEHIWEEGYRGDPQKVSAYNVPGEGLGLPKVKKIVEEHGFKISATSKGKTIYSNGLPYREFAVRLEIPLDCVLRSE